MIWTGLRVAGTAIVAIGVLVALVGPAWGWSEPRGLALLAASTGFVGIALASGGCSPGWPRWITLGLVLCWMGDFLGQRHFASGATAFLLAHLAFIVGFLHRGMVAWPQRTIGLFVPLSAMLAVYFCWTAGPRWWPLIVGYTSVITWMVITAAAVDRWLAWWAIVFYISDIFVARNQWVGSSVWNQWGCYPLYYTACAGFAWSIMSQGNTRPTHEEIA